MLSRRLRSLKGLIAAVMCAMAAIGTVGQARETKSFDRDWLFHKGDAGGAEWAKFNDASWRKLDVPHDWSIEGPFDAKNPTGGAGGFLPSGVAWYRKHFTMPVAARNKRVFIEFDGVMENSEVWVNGNYLGKRPYGYSSFSYDLTGKLSFGRASKNVIAVKADTSKQPASRWYTGAGIYRHVRLVVKDQVHIPQWGVFVTTPRVNAREATVNVSTEIVNGADVGEELFVEVSLHDGRGRVVGRAQTERKTVSPRAAATVRTDLVIKNPDRWHIERGSLYRARVVVKSKGKPVDDETVSFGIREFRFEPSTGFWLNGQNIKLKGMCLHHDGSAFGAAVPLAVWEYRLKELRKLGVNAIRTAHNPPAPDFLDLTDRMGFVVMDENFDQWTRAKNPFDYHQHFPEWWKADTRDMVRRDRNHPSVVIYSTGNEIRDNHADQEAAKKTLRGLIDVFHENDPTRPVTQALFRPNIEGANDYNNGLADMLDVVGQNYRENELLAAHRQNPSRKIIGTENDRQSLSQWLALRDNPQMSGQFVWAGVDYLGESRAWPNYAFMFGMLDRTGAKRPLAWQRQSWWSDKPMVYVARRIAPIQASPTDPGWDPNEQRRTQVVFGDWTPKNLEPHTENVEVYSNCDEVELFLNGKSLGSRLKNANDSPRNWNVNFEVGTIRAIGRNGGRDVAQFELRTAGSPAKIVLSPDKRTLLDDWNDVVHVRAVVVDRDGVPVPTADNLISFEAAGAGKLAAVDSADNADHDPFHAKQRKAFQGSCIALIKANRGSGLVTIIATSPGLAGARTTVTVTRRRKS